MVFVNFNKISYWDKKRVKMFKWCNKKKVFKNPEGSLAPFLE